MCWIQADLPNLRLIPPAARGEDICMPTTAASMAHPATCPAVIPSLTMSPVNGGYGRISLGDTILGASTPSAGICTPRGKRGCFRLMSISCPPPQPLPPPIAVSKPTLAIASGMASKKSAPEE
jgi:hypothetical protein